MDYDTFIAAKNSLDLGDTRVAYIDQGSGPPLLLLHGCPFSSFVWRKVIPILAPAHRCLAPDLLGLGDTETPAGADWSLPAQEAMVLGFLDALELHQVAVVGHDHGGAVAQMLAARHPERIERLVLCNAEAYDNWPSADERPFVTITQLPGIGAAVMRAYGTRPVLRLALGLAKAVENRRVLDDELVEGYRRANLGDAHRQAKTARFLAGQVDPANNAWTGKIVDGLRRFDRPTLLLWGADDPHFGPSWAERLAADVPGVIGIELLPGTGHLLMEERPQEVAGKILDFLARPASRSAVASDPARG
ncbi:MAG TPA: alpha/beta fold hydrolase [Acidimicrobiales bacterium]|nr:alpha/beta fold hydrolase [Acidimicrobiales bacterium]